MPTFLKSRYVLVTAAFIGFGLLFLLSTDTLADEPQYVGVKKCKMCHKAQYESWLKTKHATALDLLKPEEQKDEKCVKCHVTGHGESQAEGALLDGVQCEACHGPGSAYKSMKIMSKKKWAADPEGLKKTCRRNGSDRKDRRGRLHKMPQRGKPAIQRIQIRGKGGKDQTRKMRVSPLAK